LALVLLYTMSSFLVCATRPGRLFGAVAGPVHEDLVTGVDETVEQGLGDDEVGE
jgi:hypothetical protein